MLKSVYELLEKSTLAAAGLEPATKLDLHK
jgi:hypothetical protein